MGHINFSPDILLQSRLRKLPFQFVVEIEQKRLFEVPKSHAISNPNLLTLEREEYHWNKLYMTENYIVYLASLIYWLQAFFSFSFHTDFNECNLNNAGCEHICANNEGSFNCECRKGFKLKDDKYGCEGA